MELALVIWVNDRPVKGGTVRLKDIASPRKETDMYRVGDRVMAPCYGYRGIHDCIIAKLGVKADKAEFESQLVGEAFVDILKVYNLEEHVANLAAKNQFDQNQSQEADEQNVLIQTNVSSTDKTENKKKRNKKENGSTSVSSDSTSTSKKGKKPTETVKKVNKDSLEKVANDLELTELGSLLKTTDSVINGNMLDHQECSAFSPPKPKRQRTDNMDVYTINSNRGEEDGKDGPEVCCEAQVQVQSLRNEVGILQSQTSYLHNEVARLWSWVNLLDQKTKEQSFMSLMPTCTTSTPHKGTDTATVPASPAVVPASPVTLPLSPSISQSNDCITYGGYTKQQLESEISGFSDSSKAAKRLFRKLYKESEYRGRTLSGGKGQSKNGSRPPLEDQSKLVILYQIIKEKYGTEEAIVKFRLRDLLKPSRTSQTDN